MPPQQQHGHPQAQYIVGPPSPGKAYRSDGSAVHATAFMDPATYPMDPMSPRMAPSSVYVTAEGTAYSSAPMLTSNGTIAYMPQPYAPSQYYMPMPSYVVSPQNAPAQAYYRVRAAMRAGGVEEEK